MELYIYFLYCISAKHQLSSTLFHYIYTKKEQSYDVKFLEDSMKRPILQKLYCVKGMRRGKGTSVCQMPVSCGTCGSTSWTTIYIFPHYFQILY